MLSKVVPNTPDELIKLPDDGFLENHDYISNILYSKENQELANYILSERSTIRDLEYIDGCACIYNLSKDKVLILESKRYFGSVSSCEHELTHLLQAFNNNNPKQQYTEMLSIFNEFVSAELLSEKYNNQDIYEEEIIRRTTNRINHGVVSSDFDNDRFNERSSFYKESYYSVYSYMVGFIYAVRLFDLYHENPNEVLDKVNNILSGKNTVEKLLDDYSISFKDKSTISSFKNFCNSYEDFVMKRNDKSEVHTI